MQVHTTACGTLGSLNFSENSLRSAMLSFCKQPAPKASSFTQDTLGSSPETAALIFHVVVLFTLHLKQQLGFYPEGEIISVFLRINKNKMVNVAVDDWIRSV